MKYKTLTKNEMKNVLGGASESSYCGKGEKLYTCEQVYPSGATTYGVICSSSLIDAELDATDYLAEQVTCY